MTTTKPVILIGFKGAGKTTIGEQLAEALDARFVDTDELLEDVYEKETGELRSFRKIFRLVGDDEFKRLETAAINEGLAAEGAVIAFGGRALFTAIEQGIDLSAARLIWIDVEKEALYERIMADGIPAFFDQADPRNSFDQLYTERAPIYAQQAALTVDNSGDDPQVAVTQIMAYLKNQE